MKCHLCGKDYKNFNGICVHLSKVHSTKMTDSLRKKYGIKSVIQRNEEYKKARKEINKKLSREHYLRNKKRYLVYREKYLAEHPTYLKDYYAKNKEIILKKSKEYAISHRKEHCIYAKRRRKEDPYTQIRESAHIAINVAVRKGLVVKKPCEVCGKEESQAHHLDYSKPLNVTWLCKQHHQEWHKKNTPIYPF